jgi:hypothetical protein
MIAAALQLEVAEYVARFLVSPTDRRRPPDGASNQQRR